MHNLNLNLKHLRYFWAVASHGSIARASGCGSCSVVVLGGRPG